MSYYDVLPRFEARVTQHESRPWLIVADIARKLEKVAKLIDLE